MLPLHKVGLVSALVLASIAFLAFNNISNQAQLKNEQNIFQGNFIQLFFLKYQI